MDMDMDAFSPKLRPWLRFHPPDDKVVDFFLRAKITGDDDLVDFIPQAQSCKWEPWDLKIWLDSNGIKTKYPERWFFSPQELKHRSGNRSNRATKEGYWKVTGKDKLIMSGSTLIGKKKFLVFYKRRGKKAEKTNWVIHEYHTTLKDLDGTHPGQNAFVLCRLSYKHEKSIKDPNINDARPAVSSPATSKSFLEESESELLLASVFPASEVHSPKLPENCDGTISVTTTAAECHDKCFTAHVAENQIGEFTTINDYSQIEDMIIELQQNVACDVLMPSTSLRDNYTVSSSTTAKSSIEELESMQHLDLVSPEKYFGGKTMNTIGFNSSNQGSYNACAARNEVPEATASEVDVQFEDGFSLLDLPSEPPDCNLSSCFPPNMEFCMSDPVTNDSNKSHCGTDFQCGANKRAIVTLVSNKDNGLCSGSDAKLASKPLEWCDQNSYNAYAARNEVPETLATEVDLLYEEGLSVSDLLPEPPNCNLSSPFSMGMPFVMSSPTTNDSNNFHCGMDIQYGTDDLDAYGYEFPDLIPDYLNENFPNTFGNQKNLTLVSIKDNGSCSGVDAKLANARFESTFLNSGEISKTKASSGLSNLESHMVWMGWSPNQIEGSYIPKNVNNSQDES